LTINLNKLFPRLSIRVKLVIAFALVALGPLTVVSYIGARETVYQIEAKARSALQHDLEMADAQTAQSLSRAVNLIDLLTELRLRALLRDRRGVTTARVQDAMRLAQKLLATDSTLYQVKLIDANGRGRLLVRATAPVPASPEADEGEYYAWRASSLGPRTHSVFPIELPGSAVNGARQPIAAVAILIPVHGPKGEFLGAVVGEGYASALFSHLDHASPGFAGVTGLVDREGHFLYHSVWKRHWATLLAVRNLAGGQDGISPAIASAIVSGRSGTMMTPTRAFVSFRPLSFGTSFGATLALYRVVPFATFAGPARSFLGSVLLAAGLVALLVLGIAMIAANQFTKPIFRIRDAAWQLARNEPVQQLEVTTNDEFEDLAQDFALVASQVAEHRARREALMDERTRVLEETHAELTDILEHSADAIIGLDPANVVRIWNHGASHLFGFADDEVIGQDIDTVLRANGERATRELGVLERELRREGAVVNFLTEVLAKDGTPMQVSLTATLIMSSEGRLLGTSLIVRDNRMRARLEEQMRRSERLAAISVMAAGLAHEINNPLAIIGNRIECMQHDVRTRWKDSSLAVDVDVLQQHVRRLAELTTSLLRFARDDQQDAGPIPLDTLAAEVATLLRRTFATRQLHLDVAIQRPVPLVVGYAKAIETVVVNLLLNAADATPPDGTVTLTVRGSVGNGAAEIEVCDTGPGVPLALRERIFEPFFTTKEVGHGTGLGLAVCRSIVERHGGSIRVDAPAAGGCRFVVILPQQPEGALWKEPVYS
jgi:PAS domain S-box-containing protein